MSGVLSQQRGARHSVLWPMVTLAAWRVRRTWFLLLFIALGMVSAVVIVCTIPLLSSVMTTAGLRSTLSATPESDEIAVYAGDPGISTPIVRAAYNEFAPLFRRYLGNIVQQTQFSATINDFSFSPQRKNTLLVVYGTDMQQAATHFGKVNGRVAHVTKQPAREIEVMMTPATAKLLGMHVGSTFSLSFNYYTANPATSDTRPSVYSATITAHLVGLFQVTPGNLGYWHGDDFSPVTLANQSIITQYQYTIVVPADALLTLFDRLRALHQTDAVYSFSSGGYAFAWYYRLLPSQLAGSDLTSLITRITGLQSTMNSLFGDLLNDPSTQSTPPYLSSLGLSGSVLGSNGQPGSLELLRDRVVVARIPAGVFTILIVLLILFFVSLITALLVDRQREVIALLRSRGASSGQIFGALFLQSVILSLIALCIGIPLAVGATLLLAGHTLASNELDALNVITAHPLQVMTGVMPYALVIILVALITMGLSLFSAARMDVLSLRRASARSTTRPFWQRFNLDLIAGALALLGYGLSFYVTSVGTVLQGDAHTLIATPISIIAPFFLMLGCLLLFFRIFPALLQWGVRLAERGRGAVSLLALAHVARSPRQSLRMAMLLALAIAFTLFTFVYSATEGQHIQDIANYQTGADFSAQLLSNGSSSSLSQVISRYSTIRGVLSASAGYIDRGYGGHADLAMEIRAVDPASFGRTVVWPSQQAYSQAHPLLSELASRRRLAITEDVVPAIVDQTTLHALLLQVGSTFTVRVNNVYPQEMRCLIIGVVDHIPTVNTLTASVTTGGVLVDYQTYLDVFKQDVKRRPPQVVPVTPPVLNQVWLGTKSDTASLESIRAALNEPEFHLTHIVDRYLLIGTLQADPLYLILTGVLEIGTITALLLALVGDMLASWVSARTRVVNFASLRAIGATSRQITMVFLWEQAIVYMTGLILGVGFGTLLVMSVLPQLTFTDVNVDLPGQQFFALQSALAAQIVVPPSLLLALLILLCICGMTLMAMVRIVTLPLLDQTLRLNED
jgi:ABC-type antimicrobial peptide transport system permease subunit